MSRPEIEASLGSGPKRTGPTLGAEAGPAQTIVLRRGMTPAGAAVLATEVGAEAAEGHEAGAGAGLHSRLLRAPGSGGGGGKGGRLEALVYDAAVLYDPHRGALSDPSTPKSGLNYRLVQRLATIRPPQTAAASGRRPPDISGDRPLITLDGGETYVPLSLPNSALGPPPARIRRYNEIVGAASLLAFADEDGTNPLRREPVLVAWERAQELPAEFSAHRVTLAADAMSAAWVKLHAEAAKAASKPAKSAPAYSATPMAKSAAGPKPAAPTGWPTPQEQSAAVAAVLFKHRPQPPSKIMTAPTPFRLAEYRMSELLGLERDAAEIARRRRRGEKFADQFLPQAARNKRPARPGVPPLTPLGLYPFAAAHF